VSAFPVELDEDTTGWPTWVSVLTSELGEGVGATESDDGAEVAGSLVSVAGGSLTGTAESEADGRGAPDSDGLYCQSEHICVGPLDLRQLVYHDIIDTNA
jgi:hypothetical protein